MKLEHIAGNTYAVSFPSAVGVYLFSDSSCLLIDTGASPAFGKRVIRLFNQYKYKVRAIINTHSHADHVGGNHYIQECTGCDIYSSHIDAAYLENPVLVTYASYNAIPEQAKKNKLFSAEACKVTGILEPGTFNLNGQKFTIITLCGHSLGQIGIITPDGVLFCGDALISSRIIDSHRMLHMEDIFEQYKTLDNIKNMSLDYIYMAHGGLCGDIRADIEGNRYLLDDNLEDISRWMKKPVSREEIIKMLVKERKIKLFPRDYVLLQASVSAYIAYLVNADRAEFIADEGKLLFSVKN